MKSLVQVTNAIIAPIVYHKEGVLESETNH